MVVSGQEYRELWIVQFETRQFKKRGSGLIDMAGEDATGTVHVWAVTGDEAVATVKADAEKEKMPWMGLCGLQRVGLLEDKIMNQPSIGAGTGAAAGLEIVR